MEVAGTTHILALRGRLFEHRSEEVRPVAVGDRVLVNLEEQDGTIHGGAIQEVLPRTSQLARKKSGEDNRVQVMAANISLVMVVASVREPTLLPELVDRILAGAEREEVQAVLVLSKLDRDKKKEGAGWAELYRSLGYLVFQTSLTEGKETKESLQALEQLLHAHVTVLSGPSGAGKSSLINHLVPGLNLRVGTLGRIRQGKHTTTHSQLIALPGGGHILDTPGIRNFGLQGLTPTDLSFCFREVKPLISECGYRNCAHDAEPDCAVLRAVEEGKIAASRFASYRTMLRDLQKD